MYKQRTIPVLRGKEAEYFNTLLHNGSLRDNSDYSSVARDLEKIMSRSVK